MAASPTKRMRSACAKGGTGAVVATTDTISGTKLDDMDATLTAHLFGYAGPTPLVDDRSRPIESYTLGVNGP
jgi:hypothetical protein